LALTIILLAGCAPVTVQTYQGPARDHSQIAALKGISAESPGTGSCATGNQYAFPALRLAVAAGEVYEVKCEPVPDRLSQVRVLARRVGGAQGAREPASNEKLDDLMPLLK
jgi:uncharacterized lipoprotein